MDAVAKAPKVLDPVDTRMIDAAPQPQTGVEPLIANNGARKPNTRLEDNPRLLRVNGDGSARARDRYPAPKCRTQRGRLTRKMTSQ